MKHSNLFLSFLLLIGISFSLHAQKKTILIPPAPKLKTGENFISKIDKVSFYVTVANGKKTNLQAKDDNNKPLPIIYNVNYKKKENNSGIEKYCEVCVGEEVNGTVTYRCYEVDCDDIEELKGAVYTPKWLEFSYPKNTSNGSFTVYSDEFVKVIAVYENGVITDYKTSNLKNITYSVSFETATGNTAKTMCIKHIKIRLPDGSTMTSSAPISCDKLPKPKNPTRVQ
jgi:hypothetical protein